jgi:hypothetical protein
MYTSEEEEDRGWECLRCSRVVTKAERWRGDHPVARDDGNQVAVEDVGGLRKKADR